MTFTARFAVEREEAWGEAVKLSITYRPLGSGEALTATSRLRDSLTWLRRLRRSLQANSIDSGLRVSSLGSDTQI